MTFYEFIKIIITNKIIAYDDNNKSKEVNIPYLLVKFYYNVFCHYLDIKNWPKVGEAREKISDHLAVMLTLANPPNTDLSRGFNVQQVAEKYGWTEPMLWALALKFFEGKNSLNKIAI
jgi:hypothetical protein